MLQPKFVSFHSSSYLQNIQLKISVRNQDFSVPQLFWVHLFLRSLTWVLIGAEFTRPNSSGNTRGQFSSPGPATPHVKDKFLSPKLWLFASYLGGLFPHYVQIFASKKVEIAHLNCIIFGSFPSFCGDFFVQKS